VVVGGLRVNLVIKENMQSLMLFCVCVCLWGKQVCVKLGWKAPGTRWDILPLVLSADGHDPEYFEIPRELILEVEISHPT